MTHVIPAVLKRFIASSTLVNAIASSYQCDNSSTFSYLMYHVIKTKNTTTVKKQFLSIDFVYMVKGCDFRGLL